MADSSVGTAVPGGPSRSASDDDDDPDYLSYPQPASNYAAGYQGSLSQSSTSYAPGLQAGFGKKPEQKQAEPAPVEEPEDEFADMSSQELRTLHDETKTKRDEAGKALGKITISQEENPEGVDQAEVDRVLREYEALQNRADRISARLVNQTGAENLGRAMEEPGSYQSAKDLETDLWKLNTVLNMDLPDEQAQGYARELKEKYGTEDLFGLLPKLTAQQKEAVAGLSESGVDYEKASAFEEKLERAEEYRERTEKQQKFADKHPVLSSVGSVLASPLQGAEYFDSLLSNWGHNNPDDPDSYIPLDVTEMYATNFVRNVRGTVAKKIEENPAFAGVEIGGQNVGAFLYQTGMSMGDFLFNSFLTGNFTGGLGGTGSEAAKKAAENLSLGIMGSSAAAETTMEAMNRGLTNNRALGLGAVAGLAEIVTEKISLEALLKPDWGNGALNYMIKNIVTEGSEEVASDAINLVADILISKDKSEWRQSVQAYRDAGYSEAEATGLAVKDQALNMGLSFLGGAISGGLMSGGNVVINGTMDTTYTDGEAIAKVEQTQKTASTGEAVSLMPYSQHEAENFLTGTRNKVVGFGSNIVEFVKNAISTKGGKERLYCGKLPRETAAMIFQSTGYDLSEFNFVISSDGAWHAYKHHWNDTEKTKGKQISLRPEDMAWLPEVIAHPDRVYESPDKDGQGRTALFFEKKIGNSVVAITGICSGRKVLDFDSMRIMQERSPNEGYADNTIDPPLTSAPSAGQTPLTDPIIRSPGDGVNMDQPQDGKVVADGANVQTETLVSDEAADKLLNDRTSVAFLEKHGNLNLQKGMTQEQKRAAVRQAVENVVHKEKTASDGMTTEEKAVTLDQAVPISEEEPSVLQKNMPESTDNRFVSDETVDQILRERTMVEFLTRKGDLKLKKKMTQEQKRNAVREALDRVIKAGMERTLPREIQGKDFAAREENDTLSKTARFSALGGAQDGQEETKADKAVTGRNAGTPAQVGDGSGVQKEIGGILEGIGGMAAPERRGITDSSFGAQPVKAWAKEAVVTPADGSVAQEEQQTVQEFYIPSYVIQDEIWEKENHKEPAFASHGQIYFRASLPEKYRGTFGKHEIVHVMCQLRYQPYLDFIERVPEMLNFATEEAKDIVRGAADHCKIDLFNMNEDETIRVYDEVNAILWGHIGSGKLFGVEEQVQRAFFDFDAYAAELRSIFERFKQERQAQFE